MGMEGSRGERVSFLVDSTMYAQGSADPRGVYGALDAVVRTDLFYHYSTPICAQRWLDVCEDPAYGHLELLDRMGEAVPGLAAALEADCGCTRLTLTSLGPGDGAMDERILRGLDRHFELRSYCGLDFSFELLRTSVRRIAGAEGFRQPFPIQAICGDFTDLRTVDALRRDAGATRLFTLTGFTFGNYPENDLARNIRSLMHEGDYLLLDARLHGFGRLPEDMAGFRDRNGTAFTSYDRATVRRFVFGPLEVATTATAKDVHIDFDVTRSLTTVTNGLNLIIYAAGLDTTMRLTGHRERRDRLDLAVTTLYHLPDLSPWFAEAGFEVVWQQSTGGVAFFLLKPS
jgi:hypothetical protein